MAQIASIIRPSNFGYFPLQTMPNDRLHITSSKKHLQLISIVNEHGKTVAPSQIPLWSNLANELRSRMSELPMPRIIQAVLYHIYM